MGYVAADPSGEGFNVVTDDGQATWFPDQGGAEQAYNNYYGLSNAAPAQPAQTQPLPVSPYGGMPAGGGFPMVGGTQGISDQQWQMQQEFLRQQLAWQQDVDRMNASGQLPTATRQDAYDFILQNRPDVLEFYKKSGWDIATDTGRMKALEDWFRISPEGQAAGGDAMRVAQNMGMPAGGGATLPAQQMQWEQSTRFPWEQQTWQQQFGEGQRQFDVGQGNWEQQFGEGQRQFNAQNQLGWGNLLTSQSGPREYIKYQALQDAARGAGAFGPMVGTPSWEDALQEWSKGQGAQGAGTVPATTAAIRQPVSIKPQDYAAMSPTKLAMEEGKWSAQGIDSQDAWSLMRKGWLTNSGPGVSTTTSYKAA